MYTKMHIDILIFLRTAHFLCTLHTYSTNIHTLFMCACVLIPWFLKTLHSVEWDFLLVNPRVSTWHQSAQVESWDRKSERMLSSEKSSTEDFHFPIFVWSCLSCWGHSVSQSVKPPAFLPPLQRRTFTRQVDQALPLFQSLRSVWS